MIYGRWWHIIVEAIEKTLSAGEAPLVVLAPQHKIHQPPGNGDDLRDLLAGDQLRDLRIRGRGGLHRRGVGIGRHDDPAT